MTDQSSTAEHDALRATATEFVRREVAPHLQEWEDAGEIPRELHRKAGDLGLIGVAFPEEVGGGGGDLTTLCIAIEELARVDHSMAITLEAGVGLGANPIHRFGDEAQKQRWLPDLCAGRALGGFGLTEPEAGSDAGGTRTRATLDEAAGEWVINGEKAFITNSGTDTCAGNVATNLTASATSSGRRILARCSSEIGCGRNTRIGVSTSPG